MPIPVVLLDKLCEKFPPEVVLPDTKTRNVLSDDAWLIFM